MLKRILIVFSLAFFALSVSCCKDTPKEQQIKRQKVKAEKVKELRKEAKQEDKKNDDLVYDLGGEIFKKILPNEYSSRYYFYIKLDNNKLLKWQTTDIKFHSKEIGDRVKFDYLRKDRFSDEALD